jgi:hypothetical protein
MGDFLGLLALPFLQTKRSRKQARAKHFRPVKDGVSAVHRGPSPFLSNYKLQIFYEYTNRELHLD